LKLNYPHETFYAYFIQINAHHQIKYVYRPINCIKWTLGITVVAIIVDSPSICPHASCTVEETPILSDAAVTEERRGKGIKRGGGVFRGVNAGRFRTKGFN